VSVFCTVCAESLVLFVRDNLFNDHETFVDYHNVYDTTVL